MWTYIKRGFGYGFGGRIGWEAGGFVWGAIRKLVGIVGIGLGAMFGLPAVSDSIGTYTEYVKAHPVPPRAQQQAPKAQMGKEVKSKQKQ